MGTYHAATRETLQAGNPLGGEFFKKHNYTRSPVLVQWFATYRCSLSCPHCLCGSSTPENELSLGEVERLLDEIASLGVREFLLTGGEPVEREDLPEVISMIGRRGIRWSLNTSAYPNAAVRRAMETYPPAFVAVSLDGPEDFHDSFRGKPGAYQESLRAISLYAGLTGGNVAAGTTLNARNFSHLAETFAIVLESAATSWGIHLTFPEGRAAGKGELFLSKKQLKKMLSFIAAKRKYFPVILADEIGYCGEWEPMVREGPFFCGAGRAQCVVLPDGEVVPCTTVDKSESAGNIREHSLKEIWHSGFSEIRNYKPQDKCKSCRYAPACCGGCWLQRRHGNHCFRDVWHTPRALASAASIAICLGLAVPAMNAFAQEKPTEKPEAPATQPKQDSSKPASPETKEQPEKPVTDKPEEPEKESKVAAKPDELEDLIIQWCMSQTGQRLVPKESPVKKLAKDKFVGDPAGKYVLEIMENKYPKESEKILKRIKSCLETKYRSLALISILWQDITKWCMQDKNQAERSLEEGKMLKETLQAIEKTATAWRQEIFEKKLDAFLTPEIHAKWQRFMMSKANLGPVVRAEFSLRGDHWGSPKIDPKSVREGKLGITKEYLAKHPFGETMRLEFETTEDSGLKRLNASGTEEIKPKDHIDIFDILVVPEKEDEKRATITFTSGGSKITIKLPPGMELHYGDVIRLAYEQKNAAMDEMVKSSAVKLSFPEPQPLFIPAIEAYLKKIESDKKTKEHVRRALRWKLLNIWMF